MYATNKKENIQEQENEILEEYTSKSVKPISELVDTFVFDDQMLDEMLKETSRNVARYIDLAGLTVKDLSDKTGISKGSIYKIMGGQTPPGLRTLVKIAYVLGVPLIKLIPLGTKELKRKTVGNKIDDMCLNCSTAQKNLILNMCKMIVEHEEKNAPK